MGRNEKLQAAISQLAALYPEDGELMASSLPGELLLRAVDEIRRLRGAIAPTEENLKIYSYCQVDHRGYSCVLRDRWKERLARIAQRVKE